MVFESLFTSSKQDAGDKAGGDSPAKVDSSANGPPKRKKKTRPPKKKKTGNSNTHASVKMKHKQSDKKSQNRKNGPSPEALHLSSQLKELSTQKRLQEILKVYYDKSNDAIRDCHHACIVVDCCARCGNIQKGEEIVEDLKKSGENINVHTKTALLKGYCHSGLMDHATSLYIEMSKKKNAREKPNIRTLNTMLRGCLWAAASCSANGSYYLTSEYIWPSPSNKGRTNIIPDTSSYEYSISILAQALRCDNALLRLKQFINAFNVKSSKTEEKDYQANDPSVLETLGVCFFNIAKAYALLGYDSKAIEYAKNAVDVVNSARATNNSNNSNGAANRAGGKRAWRQTDSQMGGNESTSSGNSRRLESNTIFRVHKLNELENDANMILSLARENIGGKGKPKSLSLSKFLITRVLYFSGGGTTDLSAVSTKDEETTESIRDERYQLVKALWLCFGLCAAMKREFPKHNFQSKGDHIDVAKILRTLQIRNSYVLQDDGTLDFDIVFERDLAVVGGSSNRPLNIELGSGFGEWVVNQAICNPSNDYVAVELRSDRVGQMYSKAFLHDGGSPIQNLCSVGSDCGSFLRKRIKNGTVSNIYVNHPEPPTQVSTFFYSSLLTNFLMAFTNSIHSPSKTFGASNTILQSIANGGEEPAHMLNSQTLIHAAKCLHEKIGKLIIVTDNRFYANLICATLIKVMNENEGMYHCADLNRNSGIQDVHVFAGNASSKARVVLYEGQPNETIGHSTSNSSISQKGSTYFDRLWRKGAGNHAQTHKRFIIYMHRSKQGVHNNTSRNNSTVPAQPRQGKKNRKRSEKSQQRRNERRLRRKLESVSKSDT